jgi:hypothetical protein
VVLWVVVERSSAIPAISPTNSGRAMLVTAKMLARRLGLTAFQRGASFPRETGFSTMTITRCETVKHRAALELVAAKCNDECV